MDVGIGLLEGIEGTVVNPPWADFNPWQYDHRQTRMIEHAFNNTQITDKGVDRLMEYIAMAGEAVGWEIPIGVDHWGHVNVEECIRLNVLFRDMVYTRSGTSFTLYCFHSVLN